MNPAKARYELFNLKEDPFENNNLAVQQPNQVEQLMHVMIQQLDEQSSLYPVDEQGNPLKPILPR